MSRYIDADALVKRLKYSPLFLGTNMQFKDGVIDLVEKQPTTDVIAVVRCRDCKFATEYCNGDFECRCPHTPWSSDEYAIPCKSDDFCSYGERKEK